MVKFTFTLSIQSIAAAGQQVASQQATSPISTAQSVSACGQCYQPQFPYRLFHLSHTNTLREDDSHLRHKSSSNLAFLSSLSVGPMLRRNISQKT